MSAAKTEEKKPAKKKTAEKKLAKKKPAIAGAGLAATPRGEDIAGIAAGLPDVADWRQAARALKVYPLYAGAGAVPFSRLRATRILDPMRGQKWFNDFYRE